MATSAGNLRNGIMGRAYRVWKRSLFTISWRSVRMPPPCFSVGAVLVELLADGRGAAHIGFHSGDIRWWWLGRLAEEPGHDEGPTHDGRSRGAVRRDFQDRRLGEKTAARTARGQGDAANRGPA